MFIVDGDAERDVLMAGEVFEPDGGRREMLNGLNFKLKPSMAT